MIIEATASAWTVEQTRDRRSPCVSPIFERQVVLTCAQMIVSLIAMHRCTYYGHLCRSEGLMAKQGKHGSRLDDAEIPARVCPAILAGTAHGYGPWGDGAISSC